MKSNPLNFHLSAALATVACISALAQPSPAPAEKPQLDVIVETDAVHTGEVRRSASSAGKLRRKAESDHEMEMKWAPRPGEGKDGKFTVPFFSHPGERTARTTMVIRNSSTDTKTISQIQEDLAVMSRIIEKSAREVADSDDWNVMGIKVITLGGRDTRNLYLEDYGVILSLRVNLALLPEGKTPETEAAGDEEGDGAWEEARNEVLGSPHRRENLYEKGPRKREFDADAVTNLKKSLIDALRNASKIRHLKPSDWVTLVVQGQGGEQAGAGESAFRLRLNDRVIEGPFEESEGTATMVLRVKKSDLDEQSKKKSGDGFEKKVVIAVY